MTDTHGALSARTNMMHACSFTYYSVILPLLVMCFRHKFAVV